MSGIRRDRDRAVAVAALALGLVAGARPLAAGDKAGTVLPSFPTAPDPAATYVVYLHGRIVEEHGREAVSPEHGRYELDAIHRALAARGAIVVGEVRPRGTDAAEAGARLAREGFIYRPLAAWVEPALDWAHRSAAR